jgi:hypothetical protein
MDVNLFNDTWLGIAITLQVALGFTYLSGLAIARRALTADKRNSQRR